MDYMLQVPKWIYNSTFQKFLQTKNKKNIRLQSHFMSNDFQEKMSVTAQQKWYGPLQILSQHTHLELDQ